MNITVMAGTNSRRVFGTMLLLASLHSWLFGQLEASDQSATAQQVAAEVASIEAGMTPALWLQQHPSEKLQLYNGRQLANDTEKWCARTVLRHAEASGRVWTRTIYFYDPQPPADDALPAPASSPRKVTETSCQLGLVWIDVPETNPAIGADLVKAMERSLTAEYGGGRVPQMPGGFGSAGWVDVQQWQVKGGAIITVAYDQFGGRGRRALVRMAFPNSDAVHDIAEETEQSRVEQRATLDEVMRRIEQVGMPAAISAEISALLSQPDFFAAINLPKDTQVVAAFQSWVAAAKSRRPGEHALALLAADRALDFLGHNGVQLGDAARAQMGELGAKYVHNELAGGPVYTHGLLLQAKAAAPPGAVADAVLLLEMERGFDETGMCGAGAEEFSPVIQQGESLLAGSRLLPPRTAAALHFMVADAYTTIVWLATTADSEYHDPKQYQPQAESARQKALEHFRAALALEHGTTRSHAAWREAWRLAAGLAPTAGRYFCIYD